jgi:hypothetical protein
MNSTIEHWKTQLVALSADERAELADFLMSTLEPSGIDRDVAAGATAVEPDTSRIPRTLAQLLEGVNDTNLHHELETGPAVGEEVW